MRILALFCILSLAFPLTGCLATVAAVTAGAATVAASTSAGILRACDTPNPKTGLCDD